jgi:hypothetical protein
MNKAFETLQVGDRFTLNNKEYVKTQDIRISCCKTVNAKASDNSSHAIYVQPTSMVTVNA